MTNKIKPPSEAQVQAALYIWAAEKHHELSITNSMNTLMREADFLTMTRSRYCHEIEIKRTMSDYKADFRNKGIKHRYLKDRYSGMTYKHHKTKEKIVVPYTANYFWFCTTEDLEIDPPEYAGWMQAVRHNGISTAYLKIRVIKKAPLLHRVKMTDKQILAVARTLTDRLSRRHRNEQIDQWHIDYPAKPGERYFPERDEVTVDHIHPQIASGIALDHMNRQDPARWPGKLRPVNVYDDPGYLEDNAHE